MEGFFLFEFPALPVNDFSQNHFLIYYIDPQNATFAFTKFAQLKTFMGLGYTHIFRVNKFVKIRLILKC